GDYSAVVSFASRDRIRGYIEECVEAAVRASAEGFKDDVVARKLLEHSEQRFRLPYILGKVCVQMASDRSADDSAYDEDDDDEVEGETETASVSEITEEERQANGKRLAEWIDRCKA